MTSLNQNSYFLIMQSMNLRVIITALFLVLSLARNYPHFNQCDYKWAQTPIGFSSKTICEVGGHLTSVSMALDAVGQKYNPGKLNTWLQERQGFNKDMILWQAVTPLGLQYAGTLPNSYIFQALSAGSVVIIKIKDERRWVLAVSMKGTTIKINDPLDYEDSYGLADIAANQSILYAVPQKWLGIGIQQLEYFLSINDRRNKVMKSLRND